ncbi:MAG: hypothetical protein JNG89_04305 [Planctomycetaceae bacterium]|nr:hypothetical protein [Planctomycetaceae bacterium]
MSRDGLPDEIRRFILTSIVSVPYLEAMLLMRNEPDEPWDAVRLARRLYMDDARTGELLALLLQAGVLSVADAAVPSYCYAPATVELRSVIDRLAEHYRSHLVEVTNLIHMTTNRRAQQFADAFRLRKEP